MFFCGSNVITICAGQSVFLYRIVQFVCCCQGFVALCMLSSLSLFILEMQVNVFNHPLSTKRMGSIAGLEEGGEGGRDRGACVQTTIRWCMCTDHHKVVHVYRPP